MKKVEDYVRSIPDFPEPGIIFRDITTILQDPDGLKLAIDGIMDFLKDKDFAENNETIIMIFPRKCKG